MREVMPAWQHRAEQQQQSPAPMLLMQRQFVAATALTTVQPAIPPMVRKFVKRPMVITVVATVNADGRVQSTSTEPRSVPWQAQVAAAAREAATSWRFRPASIDGRPVPSEVTINFRISP
jgi:TonB family protein